MFLPPGGTDPPSVYKKGKCDPPKKCLPSKRIQAHASLCLNALGRVEAAFAVLSVVACCKKNKKKMLCACVCVQHGLMTVIKFNVKDSCTRTHFFHFFCNTQGDFQTNVFQLEVSFVPAPHPPPISFYAQVSNHKYTAFS